MFQKILVANRGEIAVRIIRACKEMGIDTVAVYSQADRDCLHVRLADEAVCVGDGPSRSSYLHVPAIIGAMETKDVDAVHPGYGFLSENAGFIEICREHSIAFIGPSPEAVRRMGDKAVARETMKNAGVPVIPGSEGTVTNETEALKIAARIGYPVLIKASAGGGGKGMRITTTGRICVPASSQRRRRRRPRSAMTRSTWSVSSTMRAISRCRSWRTNMEAPSTWANGSAPSSGGTRS